jgi:hypothetical protein
MDSLSGGNEFFYESQLRKGHCSLIRRDEGRLELAIIKPNHKQADLYQENGELKPKFMHGGDGDPQIRVYSDLVVEKPIPLEISDDLRLVAQEAIDQFLEFERRTGGA